MIPTPTPLHPVATTQAGELSKMPTLPQSLLNLIGEYGMARTDGLNELDRLARWEELIVGIKAYAAANQAADSVPVALDSIEQHRIQMAAISTASSGYWTEAEGVHPDYDTVALRDVAKLYAKYDALYKAAHPSPTTAPASESIDNNEFNALLEAMCEAWGTKIPPYMAARANVIAHINAHTAAQVAASKPAEAVLIEERAEAYAAGMTDGMARRKPASDSEKGIYWFDCLSKCAEMLDIDDETPIPSGVVAAVEKLVGKPAAASGEADELSIEKIREVIGAWVLDARSHGLEEAAMLIDKQRVMTLRPADPCSEKITRAVVDSGKSLASQIRRLKDATPPSQAPALPATGEALTDERCSEILTAAMSETDNWADSQPVEPTKEQIAGRTIRFIIIALKGA